MKYKGEAFGLWIETKECRQTELVSMLIVGEQDRVNPPSSTQEHGFNIDFLLKRPSVFEDQWVCGGDVMGNQGTSEDARPAWVVLY